MSRITEGRLCRALAVAAAGGALAAGCDGESRTAGIDGSGAPTPIVTEGPIEGFGSVIVNGRRFEVSSAEIDVNGTAASEADLGIGQVVTVRGSVDGTGRASADTVEFSANLRGPVESVDAAAGIIVALSQRVLTGPGTVLELSGAGLAALAAGDFVEISGLVGAGGFIHATRVERESAPGDLRVVGTASSVDRAALRFRINDLVVDYSGAAVLEGFPSGGPEAGDEVVVIGVSLDSSGVLPASRLELRKSGVGGFDEGDEVEVEGLVTRFVSAGDFDVAGEGVRAISGTVYEGGSAANLALNVKVQVEGRVGANGVIEADKVEIKDGGVVQGADD